MLKLLFVFISIAIIPISANLMCNNESPADIPKYHFIEKCHRSTLGIAAKANFGSLSRCQSLGVEKKALALNFSPPEAAIEDEDSMMYTCEVLKCSEADGGLSLVNDTRYDYYSIYARPLPNVNSTCIPAIGMFHLLQNKSNFSQAIIECHNINGVLADVVSEQRTDALAQVLAGATIDAALIGMKRNKSSFYGINGDTLDCTTYRAWAPGHPRRYPNRFNCMILTRHRTWQSVPCEKPFPVFCELIANGPYKKGSIFSSKEHQKQKNYKEQQK